MKLAWGSGSIELMEGDITRVEGDAIVTAANEGLLGGGGVDGAVHRAGGPRILEECRRIGGCPTGQAVATTAGELSAKWVIHTVGPIWASGNQGEAVLLASAYRESLRLAGSLGAESIAFPSISTGVYGYPLEEAAVIALATLMRTLERETSGLSVTMVLFDAQTHQVYCRTLDVLGAALG